MAANAARGAVLQWGDESPQPEVAGLREWNVVWEGEALDITNNDSDGNRTLLTAEGVRGCTITCSGVVLDTTLRADKANAANVQQAATFTFPDGDVITGTFHLQAYSDGGDHENPVTFEATFVSSGSVTRTPAA
jgi:predicted secreted protein